MRAEPETRQAQRLAPVGEANRRMDVARERIPSARRARLVVQHEGPERAAGVHAADAPGLGRVARARIVVAPHEGELEIAARAAPLAEARERARRASVFRMQEVAEEND